MELVPFEIAKKLDDKGFNKPTSLLYNDDGTLDVLHDMFAPAKNTFYRAPNIYEVLEWLREEKSLHIRMSVYWIGWCFDITDMNLNPNNKHIYGSECKYRKFEQAALAGIEYTLDNLI